MDRTVELAFDIGAAADHRAHRTIRRQRNERALRDVAILAHVGQRLFDCFLGCRLAARVERGANSDAARRIGKERAYFFRNPVDEIFASRFRRMGQNLGGIFARADDILFAKAAGIDQPVEHLVCACAGAFEIVGGREAAGSFRKASEDCRFGERDIAYRLAEIITRGGIHAVISSAHIDAI